MFEERTGIEINQIVILVVTEDGVVQEFVKTKGEYIPKLIEAIDDFTTDWEKKMKWFIVVVMMSHTNLSGVEETPLFIGFKDFPDRQLVWVMHQKIRHTYFAKAISEYGNKLKPNIKLYQ